MVIRSNVDNILIATNGTNGQPGAPGTSSYIHIKYSNDGGATFTANSGETIGAYIGIYKDFAEEDSNNVSDYQWKKIEGEDGEPAYTIMLSNENFSISTDTSYTPIHTQSFTCNVTILKGSSPVGFTITSSTDTENDITTTVNGHTISIAVAPVEALTASQGVITLTITTTDNHTFTKDITWSVAVQGRDGQPGSTGVSITDVTNYYLATLADSGVTKETSGWTTTIQNISDRNPYLWNYEVVTGSNGSIISSTDPVIIGRYGRDGEAASEGRGIYSIVEHYQVSSSNTTPPTTWSDTPVTTDDTNKYLWNYETITYTDNTSEDTQKRVIGTHGETGTSGRGIVSITEYFLLSNTDDSSEITFPEVNDKHGWTTVGEALIWSKTKPYLWHCTEIVYENPSSTEYIDKYCDTSWKAADLVQANLTSFQQGVDNVIDRDNQSIRSAVWENTYTYKPKTDGQGNYMYDDNGKIIPDTDNTKTMSEYMAEQIVNMDGITSRVSTTESGLSGLDGRMTTAESTITQHATDIEAKVNKNGVIAAINLSTETEGGSTAKISADKINIEGAAIFTSGRLSENSLNDAYDANGAADAVQTNLDNLEIGGRNLCLNSKPEHTTIYNGTKVGDGGYYIYTLSKTLKSAQSYVVTLDVKSSNGTDTFYVGFGVNGSTKVYETKIPTTSEYNRVSIKLNTETWETLNQLILSNNSAWNGNGTTTGTLYFKNVKVEEGNTSTAWTPAPEDLEAYADGAADTVGKEILSRGEQLVVNGNGMTGDNTNFSQLTFSGEMANSSPGSFTRTGSNSLIHSDNYFPIDSSKKYRFEFDMISQDNTGTMYSMLIFYDVDKNSILAYHHMHQKGTLTRLARELKAGDTVIYLEDASGYKTYGTQPHQKMFIFWDYTNSYGYLYPPETYSRNTINDAWEDDNSIDKTANTITLKTAYNGATKPVGTYISQGYSAANYKYTPLSNRKIPTEWTHYTGIYNETDYSGKNVTTAFPPGTAYCRVGFLWNYNRSDDQFWITNIAVYEDYKTDIANLRTDTDSANYRSQQIYYRKTSAGAPSKNTTWLSTSGTGYDNWSLSIPPLTNGNTKYPYLYTAVQTQTVAQQATGTACACSDVLIDDTTTVIDGGNIITGTVTAREITADNLQGDHGWINLKEGKFYYGDESTFAASDNAISWNGSKLQIKADEFLLASGKSIFDEIEAIETWFYATAPTTSNEPAVNWTTDNLKEMHLRDIYFDTSSGKSYRWAKDNSIYKWVEIEDVELSALAGRVATAETNIQNNAEQISLRATKTEVSNTYATKDSVPTSVTDLDDADDYATKTYADDVADSAETNAKNDTTNKLKSYYTKTETDSEISQRAGEIALSVTETKISGIEIGGRNLLLDTNAPSLTKIAAEYDRYWSNGTTLAEDGTAVFIEISDAPLKGIKYGVRFTATTQRTSMRTHELAFRANTFEANQSYTMSFYARLVSGDTNDVRFNFSDRAVAGVADDCRYTPTSEWKKYTWTFTPTVKVENKVVYMGIGYLNIGVVEMCGFKLEKGNKATDWTPAPEDLEAYADAAVSTAKAEIKITTDGITSTVEKIGSFKYLVSATSGAAWNTFLGYAQEGKETIFTVESGALSCRAGDTVFLKYYETTNAVYRYIRGTVSEDPTVDTKIKLIAHGYEDIRPVDTIKSTINQSSDSVKIQAKHIEIDGTAIFNSIKSQTDAAYDANGAANAVQANLDNLEIGGKNLLLGTGTFSSWFTNYTNSVLFHDGMVDIQSVSSISWRECNSPSIRFSEVAGKDITISFEIRSDDYETLPSNGYPAITLYLKNIGPEANNHANRISGYDILPVQNVENTWTRFVYTIPSISISSFTRQYSSDPLIDDPWLSLCLWFYHTESCQIRRVKLEIGTKATDWTPAPEDLALASDSTEYIVGTQTEKTGSWTGVTRDSVLYTGKKIAYKLPYAGSGNASLQLKDSSGNNVGGNIAIYLGTTRMTTHFGAGSVIQMVYDGTYWRVTSIPNSNNYDRQLHYNYVLAAGDVASGALACGTSAGYKQVAASVTFDLSYPILWASGAWVTGTQYANGYEAYPSINPATTATVQGIAKNTIVYLKGTISGNTFTIASSNFLTCTIPTSEDGYFYMPIGVVANDATTKLYFVSPKDIYAYVDGKFRQVTPTEIVASQRIYYRSKVSGTVAKPTAWITNTANKYNDTVSVGNSGWSTKVTPIASSTGANATKYLFLYVCEQRKRLDGTVECSTVTLDENTTVIDGGNIVTGTVTANKLNASDINASNLLTVGAFNSSTQDDILNSNIEVGGRNLLRHTQDFAEATYASTCTLAKDAEGITIITFPAYTGTLGWRGCTFHPNIPYTLIRNKTVTLSFWYRSNSWTLADDGHNYPCPSFEVIANATDNPSGTARLKYRTIYDTTIPAPTTEWQQFVRTYNITDSFFTSGSGTVTEDRYFTIQFFQHNLSQLQFKKFKLEIGNRATDWTPAPEDVQAEIDAKKSVHTLTSAYLSTGSPYATILSYANEGQSTTFNVVDYSSQNVRIGDSVRIAYSVSDMGSSDSRPVVYINGTVTAMPSATRITITGHGLDTTVIDGSNILTNSIGANQIASNAVTAEKIEAHSISTNHLNIGDNTNLAMANENIPNSLPGRIWNGTSYEEDGTGYSSNYKLNIEDGYLTKKTATQTYMMMTDFVPSVLRTDDELYYEFYAKAASDTTITVNAWGYTAKNTSSVCSNYTSSLLSVTTTEKKFSGTIKLTNAKWTTDVNFYLLGINNSASTKVQIYLRKVIFRKKSAGELIVDGSITADKIQAGSLTVGIFNEDTQDAVLNSNLKVGGRNLIVNTNIIDVSSSSTLPRIVSQPTNTSFSGTNTPAEHGFRTTVTSASRPAIRFGSNSASTSTMNGLKAGETYTFSFDCSWKMISNASSSAYMRIYIQDDRATTGTLASTAIKTFGTAEPGVESSARCEATFTIPTNVTMCNFYISSSNSTASSYKSGDYIELANIKLEEGNMASSWTAAPEDIDDDMKSSFNAINDTISNIKIGGRNLFINTNTPETAGAKRPKIIGQSQNSVVNTKAYVTEHGFGDISSGSKRPYIRFGSNTVGDESLNGLIAGNTYTFSADCEYLCTNVTAGSIIRLRIGYMTEGATSFTVETLATIADVTPGVNDSARCETVFVIPEEAVGFYLCIDCSDTSNFADGDYIGLINLKLEEGNKATTWSPAPEDINNSLGSVNERVDATNEAINVFEATVTGWLTFENAELTIGKKVSTSDDIFTTVIDGTQMAFKQNGETVAYISNKELAITDAIIENNLTIGKFIFRPHESGDGGMSLIWS